MSETTVDENKALRERVEELERDLEDLERNVDEAEEEAAKSAEYTIASARAADEGLLEDIARECHAEYAHPDAFPFCRAVPCATVRNEVEARQRQGRKKRWAA